MKIFSSLIGQDHIVEQLSHAVQVAKSGETSQAMTHSWLFVGPPGSGRSNAAVAFAASLVCKENGCGICIDCTTVLASTHVDVERFNPTGLSIKADEVRELISRSSWSPSVGGWRIVIIEDADRLTETAANALLKTIEEPESHTVWLLCAPTLSDVPVTIRSRCRHVQLRTPSTKSVEEFLLTSTKVDANAAAFSARVSQGHIGRARFIATNQDAQLRRKDVLALPLSLKDIDSCFKAAQKLLNIAEEQSENENAERVALELKELQDAYQGTGRGLILGGAKAIKDLEKEQKSSTTRSIRDNIDASLLDIATFYRDVLVVQSASNEILNIDFADEITNYARTTSPRRTLEQIDLVLTARTNLSRNAAPLATLEALFCALK
ncbi:MAG: DNA polymerase III subunit delta' [Actinomycetota bacterium]